MAGGDDGPLLGLTDADIARADDAGDQDGGSSNVTAASTPAASSDGSTAAAAPAAQPRRRIFGNLFSSLSANWTRAEPQPRRPMDAKSARSCHNQGSVRWASPTGVGPGIDCRENASEHLGMRSRTTYTYVALTVILVGAALGLAAWLISSLNEMHERFARESRGLGLAFLIVLIILLAIGALWLGRLAWRSRSAGAGPSTTPVPADVIEAAVVQANQAEGVIRQVGDQAAKAELNRELGEIRAGRDRREFHVVIFGTGSAGKTSLINALLGREVGKTEATMGTTRDGESTPTRSRGSRGPSS